MCSCPLCKREFSERPQLSINRVFSLIADKYKLARYGAAGLPVASGFVAEPLSPTANPFRVNSNPFVPAAAAGEDMVMCDVCTGIKQPATSSCLTCTASYCETHVQPHRTTPFYAKHQLLDPREALRGRTCSVHRRLLEVRGNAGQS